MKHILRHLPFSEVPSTVDVAGQTVPIRAGQIVAWVSVSIGNVLAKDAPLFPAVLDTGHNHNFSLQGRQLADWAGLQVEDLESLKRMLVNRREVGLYRLNLWIHRNRPGTAELLPRPHLLSLPEGVAVHTDEDPRLPLIGTRAIIRNRLRFTVHGKQCSVSLGQEKA